MAKRKSFKINDSLTEGLQETITAAESYAGRLRVEVIPLRKVELDPTNAREMVITLSDLPDELRSDDPELERKRQDKENLQTLAASIIEEGIINPILVYKLGGNYRLVAGERRTLASKLAGKQDIPAKILDEKPNDFKLAMLQWVENNEREDLTLWERIKNLEKVITAHQNTAQTFVKITPSLIRDLVRCSFSLASLYAHVLTADPMLNDLIRMNKVKSLDKAAFLVKEATSSSLKKILYDACVDGASLKELKSLAVGEKKTQAILKSSEKPQESRGRVAQRVSFGHTQHIKVVQEIIATVLQHPRYQHLAGHFAPITYSSYTDASIAFQKLVVTLESLDERN